MRKLHSGRLPALISGMTARFQVRLSVAVAVLWSHVEKHRNVTLGAEHW